MDVYANPTFVVMCSYIYCDCICSLDFCGMTFDAID